ncbi:hypothetical protein [Listeria costaricensis]|uniref:hypothetical protein n=1 Tax=Listeria costaricensis TaxID=2026604 RepID=UPI000C07FCB6|nr:hypothetical protein [Listeria costaricensis]
MELDTLVTEKWRTLFWELEEYREHQICYSSELGNHYQILILKAGSLLIQMRNGKGAWTACEVLKAGSIINLEVVCDLCTLKEIAPFVNYRVKAIGNVEIYAIDKEFFLSHLYVDPQKYHKFIENIIHQLIQITVAQKISNEKSNIKVAWSLFRFSSVMGKQIQHGKITILPQMIHQNMIAQLAQAGVSRTGEVLQEFHRCGIVEQIKPITLHNGKLMSYLNRYFDDISL